jgi:hypothetical protein
MMILVNSPSQYPFNQCKIEEEWMQSSRMRVEHRRKETAAFV